MLTLVLSLLACEQSRVPEDAIYFEVEVTGNIDECHPEAEGGYRETFTYALAFDASSATIYIGEDVFAVGTIVGCDLEYHTVVIGEDTEADGAVKWQLYGSASVDPSPGDACVEGEAEWEGTEFFEIVSSEDETLVPGCQYSMTASGNLAGGA